MTRPSRPVLRTAGAVLAALAVLAVAGRWSQGHLDQSAPPPPSSGPPPATTTPAPTGVVQVGETGPVDDVAVAQGRRLGRHRRHGHEVRRRQRPAHGDAGRDRRLAAAAREGDRPNGRGVGRGPGRAAAQGGPGDGPGRRPPAGRAVGRGRGRSRRRVGGLLRRLGRARAAGPRRPGHQPGGRARGAPGDRQRRRSGPGGGVGARCRRADVAGRPRHQQGGRRRGRPGHGGAARRRRRHRGRGLGERPRPRRRGPDRPPAQPPGRRPRRGRRGGPGRRRRRGGLGDAAAPGCSSSVPAGWAALAGTWTS